MVQPGSLVNYDMKPSDPREDQDLELDSSKGVAANGWHDNGGSQSTNEDNAILPSAQTAGPLCSLVSIAYSVLHRWVSGSHLPHALLPRNCLTAAAIRRALSKDIQAKTL